MSSTKFLDEDFLLQSEESKQLYHKYAAQTSIIDYHNHLSPKDIAENRQFTNLTEIWLEGDHYKWRAMRINGIDEKYCTGEQSQWACRGVPRGCFAICRNQDQAAVERARNQQQDRDQTALDQDIEKHKPHPVIDERHHKNRREQKPQHPGQPTRVGRTSLGPDCESEKKEHPER